MRAADLVTAAVLMGVAGVVLYDAVRLGIGWSTDGPRSGFFPFWLAFIMLLTCAFILVRAARRPGDRPFVRRDELRPVLKVLWPAVVLVALTGGITVADVRLVPGIGLYAASALYIGFYMRWVGRHSWRAVVALAAAIPVVTFLIFERWFLVPMPKGPLETWLGY